MIQTFLPDVNFLLAWIDPGHQRRPAVKAWLSQHRKAHIAFCSHTETGFVRVLAESLYPNIQLSPEHASELLIDVQQRLKKRLVRWPDDVSLTDKSIFQLEELTGTNAVTRGYLLGLAYHHQARLVTLDRDMPWRAIRGATESLVELI